LEIKSKQMYLITVIGGTGQGKSPFIHEYIKGRNCFVFDVQNEYGQRTKYPGQIALGLSDNIKNNRSRLCELDETKFINICAAKRNTVCVFEEAMGFFEGRTAKPLRRLMLSKVHTQNVYIFVFHSISSVPPRLMQMTDYIVLFKTGDELHEVERKFPKLKDAFNTLANEKTPGRFVTIKNF